MNRKRSDLHDERLRATLRRALPEPPVEAVDWAGLHARITAAATPLLDARPAQRRSSARSWWQPLAGWSPFGIPVAAAASVLLVLAAGALAMPGAETTADTAFLTVEEELAGGLSAGARVLFAETGGGAVLDVALFAEGEDW